MSGTKPSKASDALLDVQCEPAEACSLPSLADTTAGSICDALRGTSVVIVGDSVGLQHFDTLVCILMGAINAHHYHYHHHRLRRNHTRGRENHWSLPLFSSGEGLEERARLSNDLHGRLAAAVRAAEESFMSGKDVRPAVSASGASAAVAEEEVRRQWLARVRQKVKGTASSWGLHSTFRFPGLNCSLHYVMDQSSGDVVSLKPRSSRRAL